MLIDGDAAERAAALAIAMSGAARARHVADIASDRERSRLRQLSDEVSRIAATLARLSVGPGATAVKTAARGQGRRGAARSLETVRAVIRARRLRARYFDEELFADPAWDMLLDLLQAEIAQPACRYRRCALPPRSRRRPRSAGSSR